MKSGGPVAAVNLSVAAVNLSVAAVNLSVAAVNLSGAAEKRSLFEVLGAGKRNSDFCCFLSKNHDFQ